jgi:hypothetical protein
MALSNAKANRTKDGQRNSFLEPILSDAHGAAKVRGILTQGITEAIRAAKAGGAPLAIINCGAHPSQAKVT